MPAATIQAIYHTTVDLMKKEVQEHGAQRLGQKTEPIIFKLTWVWNILYVQ